MASIDEKLNKSLDDLIKEAEQKRRQAPHPKKFSNGRGREKGRQFSGRRRRDAVDRMDVDDTPPQTKPNESLKAQGGIQKRGGRQAAGRTIPKGDIHGQWKHDLHQDNGPARPRRVENQKQSSGSSEIHRRLIVENVPTTVTRDDMFDLVSAAGSRSEIENINKQQTGHSVRYTIDFTSEKAAYKVYQKYQDVALDDQPVRLRVTGMSMPHTLQSGVKVTRVCQAASTQKQQSGGVRGRGVQGNMRSDQMME